MTPGVLHSGEFTRAIKRPLGAATSSKLLGGILLSGKLRAGMASDPSIRVDPRIKESTSCKMANRYYEGNGVRGVGDLGAIPVPSSPGDVILGNSQFVTLLFHFSFFFRLPKVQTRARRSNGSR